MKNSVPRTKKVVKLKPKKRKHKRLIETLIDTIEAIQEDDETVGFVMIKWDKEGVSSISYDCSRSSPIKAELLPAYVCQEMMRRYIWIEC